MQDAPRKNDAERPDEKKKRRTVDELISDTAKATADEVVAAQRRQRNMNFYRTTERLLRSYKKYKAWEDDPESYGFFPMAKSKDISVAPPPGSGVRDRVEIYEEFVNARKASFQRTMARYYDIKAVVEKFQNRPEFIVIRMYYFGEDANGNDRGDDAKKYTWEEIADELAATGTYRSVTTLRSWRSNLVQEMTVLLFGIDGALSIEAREPKQGQKKKPEEKAGTDDA